MKKSIEAVRDRMESSRREGARAMWYMLFTDTLLDVLQERSTVTHEDIRAALQANLDDNREKDVLRIGYEEALLQLEAHWPR